MRLIDADALIERLKHSFYDDETVSIGTVTETFLKEICSPTVDVESANEDFDIEPITHFFQD